MNETRLWLLFGGESHGSNDSKGSTADASATDTPRRSHFRDADVGKGRISRMPVPGRAPPVPYRNVGSARTTTVICRRRPVPRTPAPRAQRPFACR
jgi:hypothetical protein